MSESELRQLLTDAVPEASPAGDRAEAARTWARRRRNRYVAGVSMAAVAIAIGIPVGLAQSSHQRVEPAPQLKEFACPPVQQQPAAPQSLSSTPGRLSNGPIAVRLCGSDRGYQSPVDALVGQAADDLASSVRAVGPQKPPSGVACNLALIEGRRLSFVFSYPDGHTEGVTVDRGCPGGVSIGNGQVRGLAQDAVAIFKQFNAALLAQRLGQQPPSGAQTTVSCASGDHLGDGRSQLDQGDVPSLTSAVLCWDGNLFSQQPTQEDAFDPQDLRLVLDRMRSDTSQGSVRRDCGKGSVNYRIVGETAWGDRYVLYGDCGSFEVGSGDDFRIWKPQGEAAAILAKMVATGSTTLELPAPATSVEQVLFTWADLVNAGDPRADDLWVHGQPSGVADVNPVFISPGKGDVLPNGQRVTAVAGYAQAVEMDALWGDSTATCPDNRAKTFVLVRQSDFEPWRILSWSDHGLYQHGLGC
ncbi:hypothetical protein [Nocardioides marmorisolisilvae]|uniref:Uncharacterized protein n=1 Tax=Nocardioides marmorisolisilvae TaxID=1542737 RepID=A0A3N0DUD1_9ACTN|nr:hypothetical protein [Nocardioides marmorisolisilvae]RNL79244.1 hypothetical protein EFL95_09505 [Nocardioides marmorisolisilvae]